ncbi:MAG: septal ring lytic transglycosylase RlpA family protein [Deltaproteobacteria bacterium]|nr:septal ring lytic transglycosylase RlpA family protein [Deltaproteobacteria bacterium]
MIALIPQLESSLAYLRPEAQTSQSQESFAEVLQAASAQIPPQTAAPPQYVVQKGDNLSEIAKKLGFSDPMQLARINGIKNPDLIQVGQVLELSTGDTGKQGNPSQPAPLKAPQGRKAPTAYAQGKNISARAGTLVVASWYGANHQGKTMANGQRFDMFADTAAHRTLPMGTKLDLTNPANGRTATVEVTDRGPFIRGRNLDVSYGVARKLGIVNVGVTKLRMNKS